MSELKLLPCPFCSGESIVVKAAKCGRYIACWDCGCRTEEFETDYAGPARDKAVAAWNRRAQPAACEIAEYAEDCKDCGFCAKPANGPLTLDELREMGGEPVYCAGKINFALTGWGIVNCRDDTIVDNNGDYWDFKELGDTYLAYRRKPEGSENDGPTI